jgi:hypothetical protein
MDKYKIQHKIFQDYMDNDEALDVSISGSGYRLSEKDVDILISKALAEQKSAIMSLIKEMEEKTAKEYPYKIKGDRSTYNSYNEAWSDACDILANRILEALKQRRYR